MPPPAEPYPPWLDEWLGEAPGRRAWYEANKERIWADVDAAPPFTPEQLDKLAILLQPDNKRAAPGSHLDAAQ